MLRISRLPLILHFSLLSGPRRAGEEQSARGWTGAPAETIRGFVTIKHLRKSGALATTERSRTTSALDTLANTSAINLQRIFDLKAGAYASRVAANPNIPLPAPDDTTIDRASEYYNKTVNTLYEEFLIDDSRNPPKFKIAFSWGGLASSALTKETARRINDIQDELVKIGSLGNTWYHVGCKRELPKNACYVGRFKECSRSCGHRLCGDER
jgi:hypothetical protein